MLDGLRGECSIAELCRREGIAESGIVKLSGGWHSRHMTSQTPNYHGYRFPPGIISHAVWLYHRFCLSFRDAEDLLAQRGVTVTYETIRHWCRAFGPDYARRLRRALQPSALPREPE